MDMGRIEKACVNDDLSINSFPRLVMGRFCPPDEPFLVARLLPWLVDQLNTAVDSNHRIAFLAALGNLGHEVCLLSLLIYKNNIIEVLFLVEKEQVFVIFIIIFAGLFQ